MASTGVYDVTGLTQNAAGLNSPTADTGDLRRQFNFGSKEMARLDPAEQPYVHILSLFQNLPTDDSQFKFIERRPSFNKRYAYIVEHSVDDSTWIDNNATVAAGALDEGDTFYVQLATDYSYSGNLGPRIKSGGLKPEASAETRPRWVIVGTIITAKVAISNAWGSASYNGTTNATLVPDSFINLEVTAVDTTTYTGITMATCTVVKGTASALELCSFYDATTNMSDGTNAPNTFPINSEEWGLESKRCYASGNAWAQGSGMPNSWIDQPFSVGTGLTQIIKTTVSFDGTTMATVMKLDPSEYMRVYKEKLFEHQVDKAAAMYWGHQRQATTSNKHKNYTQGTIDYGLSYGNQFEISSSTSRDDFQQNLTELKASGSKMRDMMFFADTVYFNWLFSLSGYPKNNVALSSQYRAFLDITPVGSVKAGDITFTIFATPVGNIKVAEDPMLNGSPIAMFGVPIKTIKYRPLVGNGINRDTTVLRGVETEASNGTDVHTDLIRTEFGMQHGMPEGIAVWTRG